MLGFSFYYSLASALPLALLLGTATGQETVFEQTQEDGSVRTMTGQMLNMDENGIPFIRTPLIEPFVWPTGMVIDDVKGYGWDVSARFNYILDSNSEMANYCFTSMMSQHAQNNNLLTTPITPPPPPPTLAPVIRTTDTDGLEVDTQCCGQCTASFGHAVSLIVWPEESAGAAKRNVPGVAMHGTAGTGSSRPTTTSSLPTSSSSKKPSTLDDTAAIAQITPPPSVSSLLTKTLGSTLETEPLNFTSSVTSNDTLPGNSTSEDHNPSIVVSDGFTFTSPTVYIAVSTVYGQDVCGGRVDGGVDSTTYHPITMSNLRSIVYISYTERAIATTDNPYDVKQQQIDCADWSRTGDPHTYKTESFPNTLQTYNAFVKYSNPCSPMLAFPTELLEVHPAVKSCVGLALLDPPQTLTKWSGGLDQPPATPAPAAAQDPEPAHIFALPQNDAAPQASPKPNLPAPSPSPSPAPSHEHDQPKPNPAPANEAQPAPSPGKPQPDHPQPTANQQPPEVSPQPNNPKPDGSAPNGQPTQNHSNENSPVAHAPEQHKPETISAGGLHLTIMPQSQASPSNRPMPPTVQPNDDSENHEPAGSPAQQPPNAVQGPDSEDDGRPANPVPGSSPSTSNHQGPNPPQSVSAESPSHPLPEIVVAGQTLTAGGGPITAGSQVISWASSTGTKPVLAVGTETTTLDVRPGPTSNVDTENPHSPAETGLVGQGEGTGMSVDAPIMTQNIGDLVMSGIGATGKEKSSTKAVASTASSAMGVDASPSATRIGFGPADQSGIVAAGRASKALMPLDMILTIVFVGAAAVYMI